MPRKRASAPPRRAKMNGLIPLLILAVAIIVIALTTISPKADVSRTGQTVSLSGLQPSSGKIGSILSIRGRGLQPGTTQIFMGNGVVTNFLSNSTSTAINVYVPDTVCKPPVISSCNSPTTIKPGKYSVYVMDLSGHKSNALTFTVTK